MGLKRPWFASVLPARIRLSKPGEELQNVSFGFIDLHMKVLWNSLFGRFYIPCDYFGHGKGFYKLCILNSYGGIFTLYLE